MSESGLKENQAFVDHLLGSAEEAKSMQNERISSFPNDPKYDLDNVIKFDFSILKTILVQLLNQSKDNFLADANFRMDILKNRVDQLVIENEDRK